MGSPRPRALTWIAAGVIAALALGCANAEMPEVVVTGSAAGTLAFHDWEQVVIGGKVVKWEATMTRRNPEPIGYMVYTLYDPAGKPLSRATLDYRNSFLYDGQPFDAGDSLPVSIAAYKGDAYGNVVSRIEIEVQQP